jgi:hypothetical protein
MSIYSRRRQAVGRARCCLEERRRPILVNVMLATTIIDVYVYDVVL